MLTHAFDVVNFTPELAAMIGLGVGIDYALFVVTRYRAGLDAGLEPDEAIVTAMDTSGRAVLFAGVVVVIAMLGQLLVGVSFLRGPAVGSSLDGAADDARGAHAAAGGALEARRAESTAGIPSACAAGACRQRPRLLGALGRADRSAAR